MIKSPTETHISTHAAQSAYRMCTPIADAHLRHHVAGVQNRIFQDRLCTHAIKQAQLTFESPNNVLRAPKLKIL